VRRPDAIAEALVEQMKSGWPHADLLAVIGDIVLEARRLSAGLLNGDALA